MNLDNVKYDGFISYQHNDRDRAIAIKIQKKLEKFRLPGNARDIVKNGKKKIERIFRDEDELSLADSLSDLITTAINNSDYLISICSPEYVKSSWCQKEIETFLGSHDKKHILLVLTDGEPEQSFPEILRYEDITTIDSNGNVISYKKNTEPLAADVRVSNKREMNEAIDNAVIKLAAAIFGLDYDNLKQRHMKQRMRELAVFWGSITMVFMAFALVCFFMLSEIRDQNDIISDQYGQIENQLTQIEQQYSQLQDKYASQMAQVSEELFLLGRKKDAVYAVRSVLPDNPLEGYNHEAYAQLIDAMGIYNSGHIMAPNTLYEINSTVRNCIVSPDGRFVFIVGYNNDAYIFDADSAELIHEMEIECSGILEDDICFCGNNGIVYSDKNNRQTLFMDFRSGKVKVLLEKESNIYRIPDNQGVILCDLSSLIAFDSNGNKMYSYSQDEIKEKEGYFLKISGISFNDDATKYAVCFDEDFVGSEKHVRIIDTMTGKLGPICADIYSNDAADSFVMRWFDNNLYYSWHETDYSFFQSDLFVAAVNTETGEKLWEIKIEEAYSGDIDVCDEFVLVYQYNNSYIIDRKTGELLNRNNTESKIINHVRLNNNAFIFLTANGRTMYVNNSLCEDFTYWQFGYVVDENISQAFFNQGKLFFVFKNQNYAVRYDAYNASQLFSEYEDSYDSSEYMMDDDELKNIKFSTKKHIRCGVRSSDGKYALLSLDYNRMYIYDIDSEKILASVKIGNSTPCKIEFEEELNMYIASTEAMSFFLDKDMNLVFSTRKCCEYRDGNLIIEESSGAYMVPYKTYEEVIAIVDRYLGDYVPSEEICNEYSITVPQ